jgi:hypothetical protein
MLFFQKKSLKNTEAVRLARGTRYMNKTITASTVDTSFKTAPRK